MPTPLYIADILDAEIDTPRAGNTDGWQYQFQSADGGTSFGTIDDSANSFSDGSAIDNPVALRINLALGSDAVFAIDDFDFITITTPTGDIIIWLPEKTDAEDDILYVDADGNTWYDADLTDPAGGVRVFSDAVSGGDALGNNEHEIPLEDEVSVDESFSEALQTLLFELFDNVHVDDTEFSQSTQTLEFNLYEFIHVDDDGLSYDPVQGWGEETRPSGTWTEE